jgi:receptor protein-tyrosine kinase/non-specific protein-tyrosine kinase
MSRIEKALEEALKLREEKKEVARPAPPPIPSVVASVREREPLVVGTRKHEFPEVQAVYDQSAASPFLVSIHQSRSVYAEHYRKIRSSLLSKTRQGQGSTILLTSSIMGEGKTITSLNLAVAMAKGVDHTVLLVDADLRRPSVLRYLGIESGRGLSDYLADESLDLSELLIKTGIGKLVLLPAGTPMENPSELVTSIRMKELIAELKRRYHDRYIIFDAGPLLLSAECATLASWVDGVLFVVQEGRIQQKTVQQGFELIKDCNIYGVVMNNVNRFAMPAAKLASYGYEYGYGYGASHNGVGAGSVGGDDGNVESE